MKKLFALMAMAAFFGMAFAAEDPALGLWKSIDDKTGKTTAYWKVYEKDGALFGEIITVPNQSDDTIAKDCKPSYADFPIAGEVNTMTVVNTPFIFGLKRKGAGKWAGGSIIDPKDGKIYKCKITFHAADGTDYADDTLEMRGEIGLGIGRSQYWKRTTEEEIDQNRFTGA